MFTTNILVRFGDLDGAGIAFYPNLVRFLNHAFEDFFAGHVGRAFPEIHESGLGFPTVKLEMDFQSPVRYGDTVVVAVVVEHVGRSALRLRYEGKVLGRAVFEARITSVAVDMKGFKPVAIPDWLRERLDAARD